MNTKLTLKIKKRTIDKAKKLATKRNTSISKLVENYLDIISDDKNDQLNDLKITPVVKSLSGVVKLPENYDYKSEYADYLIKKYK